MSNVLIQKEATQFRSAHGIGAFEPIRMKSWLSKLGVVAIFKELSDKFSGMAIKHGDHRFMIVNSKHSVGKQHFTIAHELYHLFVQETFSSEISQTGLFNKKDKVEYHADCFAAYLLMPEDGIVSLIPVSELKNGLSISTIVNLEQYFACSRAALLFRLFDLGLIDKVKKDEYAVNVRQSAELLGYDTSLYNPGNNGLMIGDYGARAYNLFKKEVISESHFIDLMADIGKDVSNIVSTNAPD